MSYITNIDTLSALLDRLISENIKLYFFRKDGIDDNIRHQEKVISEIKYRITKLLIDVYEEKEYKFISDLKGDLSLVVDTWRQSEYIINKTYIRNKQYVQLIPKKVDNLAHHIFKYADNIILMSATFVDYRSIMRNLGVAENDYKYIDLPSSFDPKKSPILFGNFHLNKKNLEYNFPKLVTWRLFKI